MRLGDRIASYFRPEMRKRLLSGIGSRNAVRLRCRLKGKPLPRWGNLRRTHPFSDEFGLDRGTPVDRFYIDRFFEANRERITGRILEIESPVYSRRFGRDIEVMDSVDVEARHSPTYHCDLAECEDIIPSGRYDVFLLPQTLQHIRRLDRALENMIRVVKPGGLILATAACIEPLTPAKLPDYRRFTDAGWRDVLDRAWPNAEIHVESHGNCLAAIAAMLGLAMEELEPGELTPHDRRFPVIVTIRAVKAPE